MEVRGVRNNNPLNIEFRKGQHWRGQSVNQVDGRFVQFDTMVDGLRAAFVVLRNYFCLHRLNSLQQIINRWAPPIENDTGRYLAFVSEQSGVSPGEPLRWTQRSRICAIVKAMAMMESGIVITDQDLEYAYRLACL